MAQGQAQVLSQTDPVSLHEPPLITAEVLN